jgi:hypothetical protein
VETKKTGSRKVAGKLLASSVTLAICCHRCVQELAQRRASWIVIFSPSPALQAPCQGLNSDQSVGRSVDLLVDTQKVRKLSQIRRQEATNAESGLTTASERKLSLSPHTASEYPSSVSSSESESESDGPKKGAWILEVSGIQLALKNVVCCKECGGPVLFKEELFKREGLTTHASISVLPKLPDQNSHSICMFWLEISSCE